MLRGRTRTAKNRCDPKASTQQERKDLRQSCHPLASNPISAFPATLSVVAGLRPTQPLGSAPTSPRPALLEVHPDKAKSAPCQERFSTSHRQCPSFGAPR
jgi:hypothetical protein